MDKQGKKLTTYRYVAIRGLSGKEWMDLNTLSYSIFNVEEKVKKITI